MAPPNSAATATASLHAEVFPFVTGTLAALRESGVATGIVTLRSRRRVNWLLPPDVLALIDTVIYGRAPVIGERLGQALERGDVEAAKAVGLPLDRFLAHTPGTPLEPAALAYVTGAVKRQATVEAINEAWAMIALLALLGIVALCVASVCARPDRRCWRPEE